MHIISRKFLKAAANLYSGIEPGLNAWFRIAKKATWQSLEDVRKTYPSADSVRVKDKILTVFNIGGNNFRLITKIDYKFQKIFIRNVLTHAEYNKNYWKNQ